MKLHLSVLLLVFIWIIFATMVYIMDISLPTQVIDALRKVVVAIHKFQNPRKPLDQLKVYKLCCNEIMMRLSFKKVKETFEFYESVRYPSNWEGGRIRISQVLWTSEKMQFVEYMCQFVCIFYTVWLGRSNYLGRFISQILAFYSHGAMFLLFSLYHETILFL